MNLEKPSLIRADYTGPSKRDKQLFHVIEVDHAIGKARNRLHEFVVGPWAHADATLLRDHMRPLGDGRRITLGDLTNLLVREDGV